MAPSLDGSDDFVWIGGPDEGLGIMVGLGDETVDGGLELDEGAEDAALEDRGSPRVFDLIAPIRRLPAPPTWAPSPACY